VKLFVSAFILKSQIVVSLSNARSVCAFRSDLISGNPPLQLFSTADFFYNSKLSRKKFGLSREQIWIYKDVRVSIRVIESQP